ncbi:MAG: hypothetical protein KatS3mg101_0805 [Patescibacteria group bacterium]|nr:MAG: hypothetical protein KatS3mg101_0805 [Patescibacteria group bacterium]
MWSSTKWTQKDDKLFCCLRRDEEKKIVEFKTSSVAIVEIGKVGAESLKRYFSTENVNHIFDDVYRVIYDDVDVDESLFKDVVFVRPIPAVFLQRMNYDYYTSFNDDLTASKKTRMIVYPRTSIWLLEGDEIAVIKSYTATPVIYKAEQFQPEEILKEDVMFTYDLEKQLKQLNIVYDDRYTDAFDVKLFFKTAYPHVENSLDSILKHMTGRTPENLYERTLLLKELWDIIKKDLFNIVTSSMINYSDIGTQTEIDSFLYLYSPFLLLKNERKRWWLYKKQMKPGVYEKARYHDHSSITIACLKKSNDQKTRELSCYLESYSNPYLLRSMLEYSSLKIDLPDFGDSVIGFTRYGFFLTVYTGIQSIKTYDYLVVVTDNSWIGVKNGKFYYHGLHPSCYHEFKLVEIAVEEYIKARITGVKEIPISSFINNLEEINIDKLKLTREGKEYIITNDGPMLVDKVELKDANLNYYSNYLARILARIEMLFNRRS